MNNTAVVVLISLSFLFATANLEKATAEGGDASETLPEVKKRLVRLSSSDFAERQAAEDELVKIGHPAVLPLIAMLKDENGVARLAAAQVLGEIGDARAVQPILMALKNEELDVRVIAPILARIGESAVEPVIGALRDEVIDVQTAAFLLGTIDKPAVKALIGALKDKKPSVRAGVASALGSTGDSRAVEPLITALGDEDVNVARVAAAALRRMGKMAVAPLIIALKAKDSSVRTTAAVTLGSIGDARAVQPIIDLLSDNC